MPRILIVTGEASGDVHGANLAKALKAMDPGLSLLGVGGSRMQAAGVELVQGISQLDVMGLIGPSVVRALIHRVLRLRRILQEEPLDLVVLIDNPGLNLHFARVAKKAGRRVVYYIAPQLWAWRPRRMKWMQRRVDHVVVTLPFEEALYRRAGVSCTFVGHPLLDEVAPSYDRAELRKRFGFDTAGPVIGLLPGSREGEVRALLPIMLQAMAKLAGAHPGLQFVVAQAPSIRDGLIEELSAGIGMSVRVIRDQASEVMAAADLLLVASGTATLQAAVIGTPLVIMYRTSWLTYWIARWLIRVRWIGLVNIVAGRGIVPELIQEDATPGRLTEEATRLLVDRTSYDTMKAALHRVRGSLGEPGASRRAAAVVLAECQA
ncbi:MAG: lipid-A-disaccharide synthase [Nitrospirae bacterium]|nr:MAG: lipid-A-disaccharide synthase [Nitrospirota bacterium]